MKSIKFRKSWNLKDGDQIVELCQDCLIIKRVCGKIGIWDYDGKNVIPDQKQKIKIITVEEDSNGIKKLVFMIKKANGKYEFYNHEGKIFECGEIDKCEVYGSTCIVSKNERKGILCLKNGKTILSIEFEKIENIANNEYTCKYGEIYKIYQSEKCGCYFSNEGIKLPVEFDNWNFRKDEETFEVTNNNLYGIYDFSGKEIVPIKYLTEITSKFKQSEKNKHIRIYIVQSEEGKGIYSETGKQIIPAYYDEIELYDYLPNCPFVVKKDKKYEIYDLDGNRVLDKKYQQIGTFETHSQFLFIKQNGLYGFYLINSKKIVEPQFDKIKWDSDYGLIVEKDELQGVYSINGECILKVQYDKIEKENIYNVLESKWETYLKIRGTNGLYGFYHKNQLYEPQFDQVRMLRDCITDLYIAKDGYCGIYSSIGKMVLEPEYSEIKMLSIKDSNKTVDVYVFKKENMYGFYFYNEHVKTIIEAQFTKFEATINKKLKIIAEKEDATVIIDENGKINNSQPEVV